MNEGEWNYQVSVRSLKNLLKLLRSCIILYEIRNYSSVICLRGGAMCDQLVRAMRIVNNKSH